MDRYSIVDLSIHDMDTDCIIGAGQTRADAARICAALNFMDDFLHEGAAKFHDTSELARRAEWCAFAAAALTGRCASAESWMEQLLSERILDVAKHADAMMAEADRRFSHDDQ